MFNSLQNAIGQKLDHLLQPDDFPTELMRPFCFVVRRIIRICKGRHGQLTRQSQRLFSKLSVLHCRPLRMINDLQLLPNVTI